MTLGEEMAVTPVSGPVQGRIRPPGSKSLTNRALIVAALAEGTSRLTGVLASRDTEVMIDSLQRLGLKVTQDLDACTLSIEGCGGRLQPGPIDLWCENSGTSIRFLTSLCCLGQGTYRLDGNARMRERPIAPLVEALQQVGVDIRCELGTDCPPVLIESGGLPGGRWTVGGDVSSQYLSALLMSAPLAREEVTVAVSGELVSRPYIDMTLAVMASFGAEVVEAQPQEFQIAAKGYRGQSYAVEPDASAASYFFALAAVTGGTITVEGLSRESLQGDVGFVDALTQMGCTAEWNDDSITVTGGSLRGIDVDMNAISDTAQTLACVAPFAEGPTRIRNVAHMRVKETDRVSALVTELRRVGLQVEEFDDGLEIVPGPMHGAAIETYDDHRMAMSFALLGLRVPGIRILDPGCTSKTYPAYFEDLQRLCKGAL